MIQTPTVSKSNITNFPELLSQIREMHRTYCLCGVSQNALIELPDNQLSFVVSLIRGEPTNAPLLTRSQWNDLLNQLKAHLILPFIYWQASRLPRESQPPEEIMASLKQIYINCVIQAMKTEYQLKEILTAFRSLEVRALMLKGTALAYTVYPDPALRQCGDIDILVPREDVKRARTALDNLGYKCTEKCFDISKKFYI